MKADRQQWTEESPIELHRPEEDSFNLERELQEFDFQAAFERILGKEDWTDKVVNGIGRMRGIFHRPQKDTELPDELRSLIPDMHHVAAAYAEMTEGFRDFIRDVYEAQKERQNSQRHENRGNVGIESDRD